MARMRFKVGTKYLYKEQVFRVIQVLSTGQLLVENQTFGGQFMAPYTELIDKWNDNELIIEVPSHIASLDSTSPLAVNYTHADFQQLPAHTKEEAWRRYQIILPLLKKPKDEQTRSAIEVYIQEHYLTNQTRSSKRQHIGSAISARSIQRWLTAFQQSNYDIRSLVPDTHKHGAKGKHRINSQIDEIIQDVLSECSLKRQYRTIKDIYLMVVHRITEFNQSHSLASPLPIPSQKTISRRIKAYDTSILKPHRSRLEIQADESVSDGVAVSRILERVEIDHTLLDLLIVDEEDRLVIGRPTLTYALDVYSRMPFGFYLGFEPPSYKTVAQCLIHGILPKPDTRDVYDTEHTWPVYGLPETLIVDNGKEFTGQDLENACGQLGIILERMPVKTPWFKGSVERFFKTHNTGLLHTLPGTTFSNILNRGDYDSARHACISLSAFLQILHIFLIDIYAQQWNKGRELIPSKRWQESMDTGVIPAVHTSAEETQVLLMRSDKRKVQRSGIEFECIYYRSPELAHIRSTLEKTERIVTIRYNPSDISYIYVTDPISGRLIYVPAADQQYTQGLSLWKHRIIRRFAQSEKSSVDIAALAAAKEKIQHIVANEYITTRRNKGRKTAARLLGIGDTFPVKVAVKDAPNSESDITFDDKTSLPNQHPIPEDTSNLDMTGWSGGYNLSDQRGELE